MPIFSPHIYTSYSDHHRICNDFAVEVIQASLPGASLRTTRQSRCFCLQVYLLPKSHEIAALRSAPMAHLSARNDVLVYLWCRVSFARLRISDPSVVRVIDGDPTPLGKLEGRIAHSRQAEFRITALCKTIAILISLIVGTPSGIPNLRFVFLSGDSDLSEIPKKSAGLCGPGR